MRKNIVSSKNEIENKTASTLDDAVETKNKVNRDKQTRFRARLDLAARRMQFTSWQDFQKAFSSRLLDLELQGATEMQVNASIRVILTRAIKSLKTGERKRDDELSQVTNKAPRSRMKW